MWDSLLRLVLMIISAISAIAAAVQSWRNGKNTEIVIDKSEIIHKLVNSQLTAVKSDLVEANMRINELQELAVKLASELSEFKILSKGLKNA